MTVEVLSTRPAPPFYLFHMRAGGGLQAAYVKGEPNIRAAMLEAERFTGCRVNSGHGVGYTVGDPFDQAEREAAYMAAHRSA